MAAWLVAAREIALTADPSTSRTEDLPDLPHPFAGETQAAVEAFQGWKTRLLDYAADNPAEALFWTLTGGAFVFYLAEKEANPDVRGYNDALHYISTCLSVGYARIFPVTPTGKLVASIVMAIGPSLSGWVIEGRLVRRNTEAGEEAASARDLTPMLERLDAILEELKTQRAARETDA
jgi:hypothetical protein